jgi:integrase
MLTVAQLCDQYLRDGTGTKKDSTLATDRGRIDRHIKPSLGQRKVDEVTQADIRKFMKNIAEGTTAADLKTKPRGRAIVRGGKGTATRTVGLLSGIFTYAKELGLIDQNPVHGIKRYPDKKNERFLTSAELATLGQALDQADILGTNPKALTIVRLLIYTGARRGEIERLTWKEVDLVGGRLKLDDSKTGQKVIRLNSTARELLEKWGGNAGPKTGYVFKATEGDGHFVGTPRIWSSLRKASGLHDVRLHDLRHSFASVGVMAGTPLMVVGALLGHAD